MSIHPITAALAAVEQDDAADDALVTCRECSTELPSDSACRYTDSGEHVADMQLHEPPVDAPTRRIAVRAWLTVPNDGYDYRVDVGGRLERVLGRVLEDRLVSAVRTDGPSGSGWDGDGLG